MNKSLASSRLSITWSPDARSDLRAINRQNAIEVLHCIDRYLTNRSGDVKSLKPPLYGLRLRCGDYRILFDPDGDDAIRITAVRHRREAYR